MSGFKFGQRTPLNYDGAQSTNKLLSDLVLKMMDNIQKEMEINPQLVVDTWPSMLPEVFAPKTKAISFVNGTLLVKVFASSLYSTLEQFEKPRLLRAMQEKLPAANIKNIVFKFG